MSDRATDGLEHLQAAALELIAAARAFLDIAEDLVKEPGAAATAVKVVASLAGSMLAPQPDAAADEPPAPAERGVHRINLS